jgi:hypothetical protein
MATNVALCARCHAAVEHDKRCTGNKFAAMSVGGEGPATNGTSADRGALTLSSLLLVLGFIANAIQRMLLHPSGAEDDHEAIFTEYADSDVWVLTHLLESYSCLWLLPDSSCSVAPCDARCPT